MDSYVIDTNILIVANGGYPPAGDNHVIDCQSFLLGARKRYISIDSLGLILSEYFKHTSRSGQPGIGDVFAKWLWDNQCNESVCEQVEITPDKTGNRGFLEFPHLHELENFDLEDRKFAAVAAASSLNAIICNATDSDWWIFKDAFQKAGIRIRFLSPDLIKKQ
ncbi:MAG: hypothetical protein GY940_06560 [bacterium]|nr:hypothetical protein [bacterium]